MDKSDDEDDINPVPPKRVLSFPTMLLINYFYSVLFMCLYYRVVFTQIILHTPFFQFRFILSNINHINDAF
jgi:hypothetical protein